MQLPHSHDNNSIAIAKNIPDDVEFISVADVFKQISDPSRLKLFWILCHTRECVVNLSAMMDMTSPALSYHLKQLKYANLVESHREGKEVYYFVSDSVKAKSLHTVIESMIGLEGCPGNLS